MKDKKCSKYQMYTVTELVNGSKTLCYDLRDIFNL